MVPRGTASALCGSACVHMQACLGTREVDVDRNRLQLRAQHRCTVPRSVQCIVNQASNTKAQKCRCTMPITQTRYSHENHATMQQTPDDGRHAVIAV